MTASLALLVGWYRPKPREGETMTSRRTGHALSASRLFLGHLSPPRASPARHASRDGAASAGDSRVNVNLRPQPGQGPS
jgi:hypothetical protein